MNPGLDDYLRLAKKLGLPPLAETRVHISDRRLDDHGDLLRYIHAFQPEQGWISQQSRNHLFESGVGLALPEEHGYVLEAELVKPGCSLRIRGDGSGGWRFFEIREGEDACLTPALVQESTQLARDGKRLNYRVLWRHDDDFGWRPWAARLAGIEQEEQP